MIMLPKIAACLLLLALVSAASGVHYHYEPQNRRSFDARLRRGDGFDPDMLNRFLEEYASKIKRTTEQPATAAAVAYHDDDSTANLGIESLDERNATDAHSFRDESSPANETAKKHKFYNGNSHKEDRNNGGWVTLEAIPWSKSKISKWQANPTTQHPWPSDAKPWDKPNYNKPWDNDFPSRPTSSDHNNNNKPWTNKPQWNDNTPAPSNKPWYSDRPRPGYPTVTIDKYEDPNQAQKWPPERPSWDKYADSSRPSADIITDNGPSNFPNNDFHRPAQAQRPSYSHHTESYISEHGGWNDRNEFPAPGNNNKLHRPNDNYDDSYYDRPHFSHYKYPTRNDHPSNYPSTSDGQWVLLSTNRGYSKSRQRSIKFDAKTSTDTNAKKKKHDEDGEHVPAVTSKRQVRLTVLPSINGTNTTTSHGGLLEVEKTFKTVDQSQKEYEAEKINIKTSNVPNRATLLLNNRRPIRAPVISAGAPSSSAVLAAVGAGMLPATMAMMLPMMLGRRKKRSIEFEDDEPLSFVTLPRHIFLTNVRRRE
ncbi:uncharacterized protein LOC131674217 isoform X2 [Phymastichus coffea]|uniref:uncharacterized protein LOC131674217 isoform X2 n=1 Tax=Phymastichus coffea TaxID=108790 RepID=UPI00273AC6FC|nr:uncharacterized protein LOC131674217 isoform X2 [Phymastichus coffea]